MGFEQTLGMDEPKTKLCEGMVQKQKRCFKSVCLESRIQRLW